MATQELAIVVREFLADFSVQTWCPRRQAQDDPRSSSVRIDLKHPREPISIDAQIRNDRLDESEKAKD